MAQATISVAAGYKVDNTQKKVIVTGTLVVSAGTYGAGGLVLDSVLLALPEVTTNSGVLRCIITSAKGTGYIYQRIAATGKMMVLQVPPNGSLTTAAPLQELPTSYNLQGVQNDTIDFEAQFIRNA